MLSHSNSAQTLLKAKNDILLLIKRLSKEGEIDYIINNQWKLNQQKLLDNHAILRRLLSTHLKGSDLQYIINPVISAQLMQVQQEQQNQLFIHACIRQLQYLLNCYFSECKSIQDLENSLSCEFEDEFSFKLLKECLSSEPFIAWPERPSEELGAVFNLRLSWGANFTFLREPPPPLTPVENKQEQDDVADRWRFTTHKYVIDNSELKKSKRLPSSNFDMYYQLEAEKIERSKIPVYYNMLRSLSTNLNDQLKNYKYGDNIFARFFKIEASNLGQANYLKKRIENLAVPLPEFEELSKSSYAEQMKLLRWIINTRPKFKELKKSSYAHQVAFLGGRAGALPTFEELDESSYANHLALLTKRVNTLPTFEELNESTYAVHVTFLRKQTGRLPTLEELSKSCHDEQQLKFLRERTDTLKNLFANSVAMLESRSSRRLLKGVITVQNQFFKQLEVLKHITPEKNNIKNSL